MAVPVAHSSAPPPVLGSSPELVSADPTPVLMQPVIEQVADAAPTAAGVLQAATTESTLAELGLAGHTPVGLIQNLLEFMHLDLGLPWWGAIVAGKHDSTKSFKPIYHKSGILGNCQGRVDQYLTVIFSLSLILSSTNDLCSISRVLFHSLLPLCCFYNSFALV